MNESWTLTIKKILLGSSVRPARERFGVSGMDDRHSGLQPVEGRESEATDFNRLRGEYQYHREGPAEVKRKRDDRFIF